MRTSAKRNPCPLRKEAAYIVSHAYDARLGHVGIPKDWQHRQRRIEETCLSFARKIISS